MKMDTIARGSERLIQLSNKNAFLSLSGSYHCYFLFIVERLLAQLLVFFHSSKTDGLLLVDLLEKLVSASDATTVQQVLQNDAVRVQYHALLYTVLSDNRPDQHSRMPLVIRLWNIYGRIVSQ